MFIYTLYTVNGEAVGESALMRQALTAAHARPPLQNGLPHGLMQAHRERHTSTRRKRGALLEQYDPLPEHGHRKTGR